MTTTQRRDDAEMLEARMCAQPQGQTLPSAFLEMLAALDRSKR